MSDTKRHNRSVALFLMGVVCLWQVGALVHLSTVSHEICPHGKIIDRDHNERSTDGDSTGGGSHPQPTHRHAGHDNCRQLSSITSAHTTPDSGGPAAILLPVCVADSAVLPIDQVFLTGSVYMTSPCHSPPARA